jgi:hypothetical protein
LIGYFTVFVWNIETDELVEGPKFSSNLCIAAGNIHYEKRLGEERAVFEGRWGHEVEVRRFKAGDGKSRGISLNPHNCREYRSADSPLPDYRSTPLREEHGYLVSPTLKTQEPGRSYLRADGQLIRLPPVEWTDFWAPVYSEYLGSYYFVARGPSRGPSVRDGPLSAWLLYPDGRTERQSLPYVELMHDSPKFYPARGGWVFTARSTIPGEPGPGDAGLYRLRDGKYERLSVGLPAQAAVSGDGCKVALLHAPNLKNRVFDLLDLCSNGVAK